VRERPARSWIQYEVAPNASLIYRFAVLATGSSSRRESPSLSLSLSLSLFPVSLDTSRGKDCAPQINPAARTFVPGPRIIFVLAIDRGRARARD